MGWTDGWLVACVRPGRECIRTGLRKAGPKRGQRNQGTQATREKRVSEDVGDANSAAVLLHTCRVLSLPPTRAPMAALAVMMHQRHTMRGVGGSNRQSEHRLGTRPLGGMARRGRIYTLTRHRRPPDALPSPSLQMSRSFPPVHFPPSRQFPALPCISDGFVSLPFISLHAPSFAALFLSSP